MGLGFKNVRNYSNSGISNLLELNLRAWLDHSFASLEGYIVANDETFLSPDDSNTSGVTDFSVWNSPVRNWAHRLIKNGVSIPQPVIIEVNGTIELGVVINYAEGQVTFTERQMSPDDLVKATHASNKINIRTVLELNRRPIIRLSSNDQENITDGDFSVFEDLSVDSTSLVPYIVIETFPTGSANPVMLGSGAVWATRRMQLNIATNSVGELSRILDILNVQSYRTVRLFDTNAASTVDNGDGTFGVLPFRQDTGDINPHGMEYPELIKEYPLNVMQWKTISVRKFKTSKQDIHMGIAYFTVDVVSSPSF